MEIPTDRIILVDEADVRLAIACCEIQARRESVEAHSARSHGIMTGTFERGELEFHKHKKNAKKLVNAATRLKKTLQSGETLQ